LTAAACRDEWMCPISRSLMTDPAVAADGHTCTAARNLPPLLVLSRALF
jgi:hypothetical protein